MSFFTKIVEIERVVDRPVLGEPTRISVYRAHGRSNEPCVWTGRMREVLVEHGYYMSCKEAFASHPDAKVEKLDAIRIGSEYFVISGAKHVKLGKPKVKKVAK